MALELLHAVGDARAVVRPRGRCDGARIVVEALRRAPARGHCVEPLAAAARGRQEEHALAVREPGEIVVAVIVEGEPSDDARMAPVHVGHEDGKHEAGLSGLRVDNGEAGIREPAGMRPHPEATVEALDPAAARDGDEHGPTRRDLGRDEAAVGREREGAAPLGQEQPGVREVPRTSDPEVRSVHEREPAAVGRPRHRLAVDAPARCTGGVDDARRSRAPARYCAREQAEAGPDRTGARQREAEMPCEVVDGRLPRAAAGLERAVRRRPRPVAAVQRASRRAFRVDRERVRPVRARQMEDGVGGEQPRAVGRRTAAVRPRPRCRPTTPAPGRARAADATRPSARDRRGRGRCARSRTRSGSPPERLPGRSRRPGCGRRREARFPVPASRSRPGWPCRDRLRTRSARTPTRATSPRRGRLPRLRARARRSVARSARGEGSRPMRRFYDSAGPPG